MKEVKDSLELEVKQIGDSSAYYKVLNSNGTFVFYFHNTETVTLRVTIDLSLENLLIQGEPEEAT